MGPEARARVPGKAIKVLLGSGVLLPLGLAFFPIVSLLNVNLAFVAGSQATRLLVASLVSVSAGLIALARVSGSIRTASLAASVFLLAYFSYEHIYNLVEGQELLGFVYGRHRFLLPSALLAGGVLFFVAVRLRAVPESVGTSMSAVGVVLFALPALSFMNGVRMLADQASFAGQPTAGLPVEIRVPEVPPDIYYIILDGYGREDVLGDLYSIDQSEFLTGLRERGFYVADMSTANYTQTRLSLATSLNMDYVDQLMVELATSPSGFPFSAAIRENKVRRILRDAGYQSVAFETGLPQSEWDDADFYLSYKDDQDFTLRNRLSLNAFEALLLDTTMARVALDFLRSRPNGLAASLAQEPYLEHRRRILFALERMSLPAQLPGPQFAFIHMIVPHPPFVFDPQGGLRVPPWPYSLRDGDDFKGSDQDYYSGYRDQVALVNRVIIDRLDEILSSSVTPPIIIIQGDHGPGMRLDHDRMRYTDLEERLAILNAYFMQGASSSLLYPEITPVNTFRVILNDVFQSNLELLEDKSYFSTFETPFDLTLVPDELLH